MDRRRAFVDDVFRITGVEIDDDIAIGAAAPGIVDPVTDMDIAGIATFGAEGFGQLLADERGERLARPPVPLLRFRPTDEDDQAGIVASAGIAGIEALGFVPHDGAGKPRSRQKGLS